MSVVANSHRGPPSKREKIRHIFDCFDANGDGGFDRQEMAAFVAAVNPSASFSPDQISSIVDEVFRSYSDFINNPSVGLSLAGLVQTYTDGAGDVDHDFAALFPERQSNPCLDIVQISDPSHSSNPRVIPRWASSPNHGIGYESTWKAVEDLESAIRSKNRAYRPSGVAKNSVFFDGVGFSDNGSSADFSSELANRGFLRDSNSSEFRSFLKELKEIRRRIDSLPTPDEAFDGHMAVGRTLDDRKLHTEAIDSFRRAIELKPANVRAHYRLGNALMSLGRASASKDCYLTALKLAESDFVRWSELLPQVHVNLGIVMEGEGLLINASEHYREAAILCPTHYRALKLLGSALYGVGECGLAEKALEEAVLLEPDYVDAHCDLGSVLHAMGHEGRAILAFQRAIDLKGDHLDALYNLGGLFKDVGRFHRAAEMYGRVLAIRPDHWRAQLNRAVSLLGAGEEEEARKALNEAYKLTNRVELYDAIRHLKQLHRKPREGGITWLAEDASKFKLADKKTTERKEVADVLWIRELQKATKLGRCNVILLKKEMEKIGAPLCHTGDQVNERSIRKSEMEIILRRLLHFLEPEAFQSAVKAIDEKIWAVLDVTGSGKIDLVMFFAIIAPMCEGSCEKRKHVAFDILSTGTPSDDVYFQDRIVRADVYFQRQISRADAAVYFRYLRVIYFPSEGFTDLMGIHGGEGDDAGISFREFLDRFDDVDCGFGVMRTLVKLEAGNRARRSKHRCGVCGYRITGLMFKETTACFYLCPGCYSECKVPLAFQKEEYKFKEYLRE